MDTREGCSKMFRVVAFNHTATAALADTTTTLDPVDAEPDPHVHVEGDNIYVPGDTLELIGFLGWTGSLTATETAVAARMQLQAPSMGIFKDIPLFQIPAGAAADDEEPDAPTLLNLWLNNPLRLVPGEGLQMLVAEDVAGDDRQATGIVLLGDGNYINPFGRAPIFTVRFTAAIACTAYNWVNGAITLSQNLPVGRYAIMGMHVISASGIAARLVVPGQGARPGCIAYDSIEDIGNPVFRNGNLGVWGVFHSQTPPTLDMFSRTTDTAQEGWLDLIKVD